MTDIPIPLQNLMSSLSLSGLPTSTNPGDRIDLRITPDLAPPGANQLPQAITDLFRSEVLAVLDVDPGPLVAWLVTALGAEGWSKSVEFDQPVAATPAQLNAPSPIRRALAYLIPLSTPPAVSTFVQGAISRLRLTRDTAAGTVSRVTGTLTRPGLLGTVSQPTVEVRVFDETGTRLTSGDGFFQSGGFVPSLVFLPVAVPSTTQQPTVRRSVSVHVSLTYTPPVPTPPPPVPPGPRTVTRDFGPFALDLATVEVPMVAVTARHPLHTSASAPGHVFVAVPESSPLEGLGDIVGAVSRLRTVLANVSTVLGAFGIGVPAAISEAARALALMSSVGGDYRFRKGDLVSLWALFSDWQYIMSAAMVFGPPHRRAFFGTFVDLNTPAGFSLHPSPFGVAFAPDLTVTPITDATTVGTAVDDMPLPSGSYDNMITSINFPAA